MKHVCQNQAKMWPVCIINEPNVNGFSKGFQQLSSFSSPASYRPTDVKRGVTYEKFNFYRDVAASLSLVKSGCNTCEELSISLLFHQSLLLSPTDLFVVIIKDHPAQELCKITFSNLHFSSTLHMPCWMWPPVVQATICSPAVQHIDHKGWCYWGRQQPFQHCQTKKG